MSQAKTQLYQKMLKVYEAIEYLQKDDHVSFGQTSYKAMTEEKVTMTVRAELVKNKLIVFPVEQEHKRDGQLTSVDVKYKIVDCETGESEIIVSSGTGADSQDKGVGKAMTYAFKYLFLRTFAIPSGDDPDKISNAELDAKDQKASAAAAAIKEKMAAVAAAPVVGEIPDTLKGKYQEFKGSADGLEKWVGDQMAKGKSYPQMEQTLQAGLNKKSQK